MQSQVGTGVISNGSAGARYRIDRDRRLIAVTYVGPVTLEDARNLQELARQDPDFDITNAILIDLVNADLRRFSRDDLIQLARHTPMHHAVRRAFLIDSDDTCRVAKVFSSLDGPEGLRYTFETFEDVAHAIRWLTFPAT